LFALVAADDNRAVLPLAAICARIVAG
jgi:hypothetical protein